MFQIIQDLIGNAVVSSGVSYEALCAILISSLFVIMIIGLVAGQELAFVLGGAGIIIGVIAWGGSGLNIAATKIYDQMQSYSMVAIPMFVLMANFLTHSKVADGLFLSIRYLLGPLKGGLGLAVIVVSTIFAATTGIVGASVVTMGMLSMPILLKCGYDHRLAAGMVCAGGSLGILIPPSIMLVTMGSYAEVSVGKLFFAALIPGLLLAACYAIYIIIICHIHPEYGPAMSEEELAEMPLKQRIVGSLVNLIPPLLLILGVLGSIFSGIATPTEAAGVGALVALILVFIMGMFIDWTGIVMIVLPIFLPIMDNFGVDRLWLVGVTAVILQTCFMTPPFGFALFYIKGIVPPEVKISEIYKGVIPFILIILFVTVLCIAFPQLVTGLPNLVAG